MEIVPNVLFLHLILTGMLQTHIKFDIIVLRKKCVMDFRQKNGGCYLTFSRWSKGKEVNIFKCQSVNLQIQI